MSYSIDFRECVIKNISAGMTWSEASRIFKISQGTIQKWLNIFKETGEYRDAPRKQYKPQKIDSDKLQEAIKRSPDATLEELAHEFDCRLQAIDYRCRTLKITRKKNHTLQGKRRRTKARISSGN